MKKLDKINRQMIHAEFIKIMREEKLKQGHLRQKITDVLLTMQDVWEEQLDQNKSLGFFGYLGDHVTYEGRWSRGETEDAEQFHVLLEALPHPHAAHSIGRIDVDHGFLRFEPHGQNQAEPRIKLADSAVITVTSPNWQYADGVKSELPEENIRVYHAVDENAIAVVDRICHAITSSQAKAQNAQKRDQLNLSSSVNLSKTKNNVVERAI